MIECDDVDIDSLPSELAKKILGCRLAVMWCFDARLVAYLVAVFARCDILDVIPEYRLLLVQANLTLLPAVFTLLSNKGVMKINDKTNLPCSLLGALSGAAITY